jgi:alkanesulfonate monooxygenase SsuD/methylene tetrahydromethanopterin reductase-like flavin-dependent oxidoreductase (luciferase family)
VLEDAVSGDASRMRCGILLDLRNPRQWRRPWGEVYGDTLGFLRRADEAGLDEAWLSEHHFVDDGYMSSLLLHGAAIAAQTERIRIGTWVMLLPLRNAVLVAEDAVALDVLSGGRLDLGFGLGYRELEFQVLGVDRSQRRGRFEEGFEVIRRLLAGGPASFDGKHYAFDELTLGMEPAQDPVPLWAGARGQAAARRAADLGAHLMLAGPQDLYEVYAERLVENGRDPADFKLAYRMRVFPTHERPDRVLERLRPHVEYAFQGYGRWYGEVKDLARDSEPATWDMAKREHWIIGPPDHCVEEIHKRRGRLPITDLIALAVEPGIPAGEMTETMELFVADVMPHLEASRV